jgi:hypothetical protein
LLGVGFGNVIFIFKRFWFSDPEPEAEINENVEESDQQEVRLIDRNRVFEHLKLSTSIFLPDSFYLK